MFVCKREKGRIACSFAASVLFASSPFSDES